MKRPSDQSRSALPPRRVRATSRMPTGYCTGDAVLRQSDRDPGRWCLPAELNGEHGSEGAVEQRESPSGDADRRTKDRQYSHACYGVSSQTSIVVLAMPRTPRLKIPSSRSIVNPASTLRSHAKRQVRLESGWLTSPQPGSSRSRLRTAATPSAASPASKPSTSPAGRSGCGSFSDTDSAPEYNQRSP